MIEAHPPEPMRPPLLIVGAARSDTTLMGQVLLGAHPDMSHRPGRAFVWRYGNAYKLHDLGVDDCRPTVRWRIRAAFERKSGRATGISARSPRRTRIGCPSYAGGLPETRILHVVRDGRQAVRSAREEWAGRGGGALDSARLRRKSTLPRVIAMIGREIRLRERHVGPLTPLELPAYAPRTLSFLLRQLLHASWLPWGARFPGIVRARWQLGLLETVALQWHLGVHLTRSACVPLGPEQYHEVMFERLHSEPEEVLRAVARFAGLEPRERWLRRCLELIRPRPVEPGAGLTDDEIGRIENVAGATLWPAPAIRFSPSTSRASKP